MTVPLPPAVATYFSARNAGDFATAISGFSATAIVRDERRDHEGPDAIRAWMEETAARYNDRAEVRNVTAHGDDLEVAAEVSGTFPGSPAVLTFRFILVGGLIERLEIA